MSTSPSPRPGIARRTPTASTSAVVALSLALVLGVGLTFLLVAWPLADSLDRLVPAPPPPPAPALEPEPVVTAPPPPPEEPERIRWSLLDVQSAVRDLGARAEALVADGRTELRELDDPSRARQDRRERVLRRWALWARTWRNRLEDIEAELPPDEACTVHASMRPACDALRQALAVLAAVPEPLAVDGATAHLDDAAARLDALLRPPPDEDDPSGETSEELGDEPADAETTDDAAREQA